MRFIWILATLLLVIKGCLLLILVPDIDTVTMIAGCVAILFLVVALYLLVVDRRGNR